jgi:tripeptide aminopeptidase
LKSKIGDDIITASGTTLLGADDKAGVVIIMDFAQFLVQNPKVKHGKVRILFTPDEEVGRGVEKLDMSKVNADFGYTLDGGQLGDIEDETFSADAVKIIFNGISAHPGYAKNKMVNAIKLVSELVDSLPKDRWSPETTSHREGFVHPVSIDGGLEKATVQFIIRDHETAKLAEYEKELERLTANVIQKYPGATYSFGKSGHFSESCHHSWRYRWFTIIIHGIALSELIYGRNGNSFKTRICKCSRHAKSSSNLG